jgi:hypothetical protein
MLKQMIATIKGIRDRESLRTIIDAAESRDSHLASIESEERRKHLWQKFSHLKKGDTVFVHREPEGSLKWLWGKPLTVRHAKPRAKYLVVGHGKATCTLTPHMMDKFKLSLEPTTVAFATALHGDTMARKTR